MNKKPVVKPGKKAPAKKLAAAKRAVKKPLKAAKAKTPPPKSAAVKQPVKPAGKIAAKAPPAKTVAASKPEPVKKVDPPKKKLASRVKLEDIVLPAGYRPSEDEPFMTDKHRAYFRKRLMDWKDEILRQTRETLAILHEDSSQHADLADRATSETDRATELRTRDRQRKLISKIDAALSRLEDGTYGYCEDTGEPIGLRRLDARPIATLSVEAQERHERRERVYREE